MEHWKNIKGWEDLYEISSFGNIRSIKRLGTTKYGIRNYGGGEVKPIKCGNGYMAVNFTNKTIRKQIHIHTLVLENFVSIRPKDYDACHNDGNKENNRLDNLRWDSRKNNHKDKILHGTYQIGIKANRIKLNSAIASEIKNTNLPLKEISKMYEISKTQIWRIKTNRSWNTDNVKDNS